MQFCIFVLYINCYVNELDCSWFVLVGGSIIVCIVVDVLYCWYDYSFKVMGLVGFGCCLVGYLESGQLLISDLVMFGVVVFDQIYF